MNEIQGKSISVRVSEGSSYRESTVLLMVLSLSLINEGLFMKRFLCWGYFLNIKFCSCLWVRLENEEILHLYAYGSFVRLKKNDNPFTVF